MGPTVTGSRGLFLALFLAPFFARFGASYSKIFNDFNNAKRRVQHSLRKISSGGLDSAIVDT